MKVSVRGMAAGVALAVLAGPSAAGDVFVDELHEHKVIVACGAAIWVRLSDDLGETVTGAGDAGRA